ncbi:NAD(P)-binding protein [Calocera viscosa TUFC12733]|uniref:NAD(P)-binding protein n=1 Tax=Calocera viscosa (strain TUFC12733) TaxID=1330018 RepID=A0A167KHA8_CALVF|nr:NAD(P)-binding protein [Calocera viscosa TUFC12733]
MFQGLWNVWYQIREIYPPTPKWGVDDIPDQTGKVALVTGGYAGIGKLIAKYLLLKNATVYIAGRSQKKAEEAIDELKQITKSDKIHFLSLDLSDLVNVKKTAEEFRKSGERIDMLFNNAGIMIPPMDQLTKQGYDLTWGTNVVGPSYFTILLLPVLLSSAKTAPDGKVRVINVASNANWFAPKGGILWDTLEGSNPERVKKGSPESAYSQSKWANIVFSNELAKRYGSQGIVSTAVNPGSVRTEVNRHAAPWTKWFLETVIQSAPDPLGALTPLYAGTSPEAADLGGRYFWPWARVGIPRKDTNDEAQWKRVWEFVEEAAKRVA